MLIEFDVRDVMHVVGFFDAAFQKKDAADIRRLMKSLPPLFTRLNLRVSRSYLDDLAGTRGETDDDFLLQEACHLADTIRRELGTKHVLAIPDEASVDLFENERPFDLEERNVRVNERFPDAIYDIQEAANCLALGRSTACVCHLMRVLEVGLYTLASDLKVPWPDRNSWQDIINAIEGTIKQFEKGSGPLPVDWRDKRQFYADAATQFTHFKDAWRNHAMHFRAIYDDAKAASIFGSVREFMRVLATQLTSLANSGG